MKKSKHDVQAILAKIDEFIAGQSKNVEEEVKTSEANSIGENRKGWKSWIKWIIHIFQIVGALVIFYAWVIQNSTLEKLKDKQSEFDNLIVQAGELENLISTYELGYTLYKEKSLEKHGEEGYFSPNTRLIDTLPDGKLKFLNMEIWNAMKYEIMFLNCVDRYRRVYYSLLMLNDEKYSAQWADTMMNYQHTDQLAVEYAMLDNDRVALDSLYRAYGTKLGVGEAKVAILEVRSYLETLKKETTGTSSFYFVLYVLGSCMLALAYTGKIVLGDT